MNQATHFDIRKALYQAYLQDHGYDAILLNRVDNFAAATGGKRNYIYRGTDFGANGLVITKDGGACFVGNTIEEPRVMEEEFAGLPVDALSFLWFEGDPIDAVKNQFKGTLCSDDGSVGPNVNGVLAAARTLLVDADIERYRALGRIAADAMTETLGTITQGMAEHEIAATLIIQGARRGVAVPVCLVAADDRIAKYRHPLPTFPHLNGQGLTAKTVQDYVMVVGCFQADGLVCSITRFKEVGKVEPYVTDAYARICAVDARMQCATQPGATLGDVFAECQSAYAELDFPEDEWHNHHQGGPTGYAPRTEKGLPDNPFPILPEGWNERIKDLTGHDTKIASAYAWNPSAVGVKSEDTFLLHQDGAQEILTLTPELPTVDLAAILGEDTTVIKSGIAPA